MATLFRVLLLILIFSDSLISIQSLNVGINYGQIANDLPSPGHVAYLLNSLNISRVKLYDANPSVLSAFANSGVEFVIGLGNEYLKGMSDPVRAQSWIEKNIKPYVPLTKISCITVGNEVLTGNDTQQQIEHLLPAMKNVNTALINLGLSKDIYVTTAHSLLVLSSSYPPSSGSFRPDLAEYIRAILDFHNQTGSPFLINAYPFFAYRDSPKEIPLNYTLFLPNPGTTDPGSGLHYDNMLYAQVDAVYTAIKATGHRDIQVRVSETGWPSKGDPNEVGANMENAGLYNGNLLKKIQQNQGTPLKPSVPLDIYVFALFNEDLKPGPLSERNYGLYYPNGTPVYNIGLQGFLPQNPHMDYSASKDIIVVNLLFLPIALLMCWWL